MCFQYNGPKYGDVRAIELGRGGGPGMTLAIHTDSRRLEVESNPLDLRHLISGRLYASRPVPSALVRPFAQRPLPAMSSFTDQIKSTLRTACFPILESICVLLILFF